MQEVREIFIFSYTWSVVLRLQQHKPSLFLTCPVRLWDSQVALPFSLLRLCSVGLTARTTGPKVAVRGTPSDSVAAWRRSWHLTKAGQYQFQLRARTTQVLTGCSRADVCQPAKQRKRRRESERKKKSSTAGHVGHHKMWTVYNGLGWMGDGIPHVT